MGGEKKFGYAREHSLIHSCDLELRYRFWGRNHEEKYIPPVGVHMRFQSGTGAAPTPWHWPGPQCHGAGALRATERRAASVASLENVITTLVRTEI